MIQWNLNKKIKEMKTKNILSEHVITKEFSIEFVGYIDNEILKLRSQYTNNKDSVKGIADIFLYARTIIEPYYNEIGPEINNAEGFEEHSLTNEKIDHLRVISENKKKLKCR